MKSRMFAVSGMLIAALTGAHAGDALQVASDDTAETAVSAEIDVRQVEEVGPPKPVVVVNTPATPVPVDGQVRVVNPVQVVQVAKTPVNEVINTTIADGEYSTSFVELFTVPEGKQLVVTHASAAMGGPDAIAFRINVENVTAFLAIHDIAGIRSGPLVVGGQATWAMSLPMELYVPAGQAVTCSALRGTTTGSVTGRCSISGYLVDVPE